MLKTFIWSSVSALAGGYTYTVCSEVIRYTKGEIRYRDSPFEIQNILNYGFTFGLIIGFIRGAYGRPVLRI